MDLEFDPCFGGYLTQTHSTSHRITPSLSNKRNLNGQMLLFLVVVVSIMWDKERARYEKFKSSLVWDQDPKQILGIAIRYIDQAIMIYSKITVSKLYYGIFSGSLVIFI